MSGLDCSLISQSLVCSQRPHYNAWMLYGEQNYFRIINVIAGRLSVQSLNSGAAAFIKISRLKPPALLMLNNRQKSVFLYFNLLMLTETENSFRQNKQSLIYGNVLEMWQRTRGRDYSFHTSYLVPRQISAIIITF